LKKLTITLFVLIILSLFLLFGFLSEINNQDKISKISKYTPSFLSKFLKETLFKIPLDLKYQKQAIIDLEIDLEEAKNFSDSLVLKFRDNIDQINFSRNQNFLINDSFLKKHNFKIFKTDYLINPKNIGKSSFYLESDNDNIYIMSADGMILYFNKDKINSENFNAFQIKSNFMDLVQDERVYKISKVGVKDILIDGKNLYVSYNKKIDNDCYTNSILRADLNFSYLNFETFFSSKECVKVKNEYGLFVGNQSGGRIVKYKDNKLLFSSGEYRNRLLAQNDESIFGKILLIDINTRDVKIFSKGHRNPQGLYYDINDDVILSTEHGPAGGDEINRVIKDKNYGWPIASYGIHYKCADRDKTLKNKKPVKIKNCKYKNLSNSPLYKSHKDHNFEEPLTYYDLSIAISEIIQIPNTIFSNKNKNYFVGALGTNIDEGDLSLHHIILDSSHLKVINRKIYKVYDRIRDLKFIDTHKIVIMSLDNNAAIGVLDLN